MPRHADVIPSPVGQDCVMSIFESIEIVVLAFILVLTSDRETNPVIAAFQTSGSAGDVNSGRPAQYVGGPLDQAPLIFGRTQEHEPHAKTPSKIRSKNGESWTASQATVMFGKLGRMLGPKTVLRQRKTPKVPRPLGPQ